MTGSMADDFAATLAAARAGHDGGFAALYEALVRPVAGYLRTRGVPEVEDATSEVFLDVFRGLARFSGDEPAFRAWVFTIAHRRAVDAHRRSARGPSTVPLDETPVRRTPDRGVARSAEDVALDGLALERVHDVLAGLTDGQRDVLLLRVVGDLTVDQVADVLGLSPGAVKALQRRGLDALGRRLGLSVVATGVEDERSVAMLRVLGCRLGQGFALAPPVPVAELVDVLDRHASGHMARPGRLPLRPRVDSAALA